MHATILYIDDDEDLRQLYSALFELRKYNCITAADGLTGLTLFQAERPDIVVLDYRMPGLDGEAVARALRELDPDVPILMISGSDVPESALTGVNGFFVKGESFEALIGMIVESLKKEKHCKINKPRTAA